jgi:hypothetical protein
MPTRELVPPLIIIPLFPSSYKGAHHGRSSTRGSQLFFPLFYRFANKGRIKRGDGARSAVQLVAAGVRAWELDPLKTERVSQLLNVSAAAKSQPEDNKQHPPSSPYVNAKRDNEVADNSCIPLPQNTCVLVCVSMPELEILKYRSYIVGIRVSTTEYTKQTKKKNNQEKRDSARKGARFSHSSLPVASSLVCCKRS